MSKYIVTWFDKSLHKKSEKVRDFQKAKKILKDLESTLKNLGSGLSAPQIGINKQILIAKINGRYEHFINPEIINSNGYKITIESCLSFPKLIMPKIRKQKIEIKYQTTSGEEKIKIYKKSNATVLQHEIDHLKGKTILY